MSIKPSPELHVYPACESDLVQPVYFEPLEPGWCSLEPRCSSCRWSREGTSDQAEVDRFDDELARGEEAVLAAIEEATRSNMREELDRFAQALEADAILPMDF